MGDWGENLIFLLLLSICALSFVSIGIWALLRREPMHFWSGSTVEPSAITDVKAYNRANGIMWIACGLGYLLVGCLSLVWGALAAGIATAVWVPLSLVALIAVYHAIYRKYRAPGTD